MSASPMPAPRWGGATPTPAIHPRSPRIASLQMPAGSPSTTATRDASRSSSHVVDMNRKVASSRLKGVK
jgi:hypothetical protein